MKTNLLLTLLLLNIACAQSVPTTHVFPQARSAISSSESARREPEREESLRRFLQQYEGNPASPAERTTRYAAAFVDLNDDGNDEVIVYLIDNKWCGSAGCSALVLGRQGSSYRRVTKMTVTQLPIRVLLTKTNGWHDLGVWVQGGGIQRGYEAKLRFNGNKYPSNPSISPAQPLRTKPEGKVLIAADAKGAPLYSEP